MKALLGNEPIKAYLERAIRMKHLHHTLLFSGLDGIGKSLFAKAIAEQLLPSVATRVQNEQHPDLIVLRPEGKSGTHSIERLREMIDDVHRPPFEAERKFFLIHEADRMQPVAANALLKTLEEPNLFCTLILLTSAPNDLLPTITSRCLHLTFQPIPTEPIATFLQEKHQVPKEKAILFARLSNGSLGAALRHLQNEKIGQAERLLFDSMDRKMPSWQAIERIEALFDDLEGLDYHKHVEELFAAYLMRARDQELRVVGGTEEWLYFPSEQGRSEQLASAQEKVRLAQQALERNVKLSACLDILLKNL